MRRRQGGPRHRSTLRRPILVEPQDFVHIPEERWQLEKRRSMIAKEHRLEAYATLIFRTVERFLGTIPKAMAVNPL
jgi:hypothetical protein